MFEIEEIIACVHSVFAWLAFVKKKKKEKRKRKEWKCVRKLSVQEGTGVCSIYPPPLQVQFF